MKNYVIPILYFALLAPLILYSPDAYAAGDIVSRGSGLLDFISHSLGPLMIGLGLVAGAGALIFGMPGAIQKIMGVVVGGILLTSIASVITLIEGF